MEYHDRYHCAQIGLGPLSIYYFNQFPGLFFITNIIVLPLLGAVLSIGFVIVILGCFNILPDSVAKIYGGMIAILNDFITWIAPKMLFYLKRFLSLSVFIYELWCYYLPIIGMQKMEFQEPDVFPRILRNYLGGFNHNESVSNTGAPYCISQIQTNTPWG